MQNVKDFGRLYQKAFWSLAAGVALFIDFVLLLAHVIADLDLWLIAVSAIYFTFVAAPLVAWLLIERFAADNTVRSSHANYYHVWELERLARFGKQMILYGNPIGWLAGIIYSCALKAMLRWPTVGLYIAVLLP